MQTIGHVRKIISDKQFGFIEANGKDNVFFHKEDMEDQRQFSSLTEGDSVNFLLDQTPKGPRARNVRVGE